MIYVTVGNDFRAFDRFLKKMDEIAPRLPDNLVIQTGHSGYRPKNATHFDFISFDEAIDHIRKSKLVVSHAGIGTILLCKEYGTPVLILPRRKGYGEHMNDHQMEIAKALEERKAEDIFVAFEEDRLEEEIQEVLKKETRSTPRKNPGKVDLIRTIKAFIETR
jgi:beta-1,4-N-acetylglucosaminyltransferase